MAADTSSNAAADGRRPGSRRLRFRRHLRLCRTRDFDRAFRAGVRASDRYLSVWAVGNGREHCRLGLAVGRKQGAAVRRHRLKRLLREAFRLCQHELPAGLDLVCAPRVGVELTLAECQQSLVKLARRLQRELARRE